MNESYGHFPRAKDTNVFEGNFLGCVHPQRIMVLGRFNVVRKPKSRSGDSKMERLQWAGHVQGVIVDCMFNERWEAMGEHATLMSHCCNSKLIAGDKHSEVEIWKCHGQIWAKHLWIDG
jgi:hypothetical protein